MTKERRIAIKIWEEIKAFILSSPTRVTGDSFYTMKFSIAKTYSMYWRYSCWFCHYIRKPVRDKNSCTINEGCNKCPLHKLVHAAPGKCGCSEARAPYTCLINDYISNDIKAEACDIIIKALKGEELV